MEWGGGVVDGVVGWCEGWMECWGWRGGGIHFGG